MGAVAVFRLVSKQEILGRLPLLVVLIDRNVFVPKQETLGRLSLLIVMVDQNVLYGSVSLDLKDVSLATRDSREKLESPGSGGVCRRVRVLPRLMSPDSCTRNTCKKRCRASLDLVKRIDRG